MKIGLMVEGQNGLGWQRWSHIVAMADRLGFHSLFRSDHYFIGAQRDSLEAYLSFVIAAKETSRIRFVSIIFQRIPKRCRQNILTLHEYRHAPCPLRREATLDLSDESSSNTSATEFR